MAVIDAELLKRFRTMSLLTAARAKRSGSAAEVVGLRDYVPGDDYRSIDWIRCARHDELLSRTFAADTDRHVYILLDCSPSMGQSPAKFRLARRMAAALGYAAATKLDCVGVAAFCDGLVADLPPIRHRTRLPKLFRFLEQLPIRHAQTDLRRAADAFARRYQRHGLAVVISDLYDRRGFRQAFDALRHRGYGPRVVQICDPCEANPDLLGEMELFDVEAQTVRTVTITERTVRRYRGLFAGFQRSVRDYCAKHAVDCVQLASDVPEEEALQKVLGCPQP